MFSKETFKSTTIAFGAINACHASRNTSDMIESIVNNKAYWPKSTGSFRGYNINERRAFTLEQYVRGYDRELEGAHTPMSHLHGSPMHVIMARLLGHYDASAVRRQRRPTEQKRLDEAMELAREACEILHQDRISR